MNPIALHAIRFHENDAITIEHKRYILGRWKGCRISYIVCTNQEKQLYSIRQLNLIQFLLRRLFKRYQSTHAATLHQALRKGNVVYTPLSKKTFRTQLIASLRLYTNQLNSSGKKQLSEALEKVLYLSNPLNRFIYNVRMGHRHLIERYLSSQPFPPLFKAVILQNQAEMEKLLQTEDVTQTMSFDTKWKNMNILFFAGLTGNIPILEQLLHQEKLSNEGTLYRAISHNQPLLLRYLSEREIDLQTIEKAGKAIGLAVEHANIDALKYLLEEKKLQEKWGLDLFKHHSLNGKETLLTYAVKKDQFEVVSLLLKAGFSDEKALSCAVGRENKEMVQLLLQRKADPNQPEANLPLIKAIEVENSEIFSLLLQCGATGNTEEIKQFIENHFSNRPQMQEKFKSFIAHSLK